jgi:hypothetical protein
VEELKQLKDEAKTLVEAYLGGSANDTEVSRWALDKLLDEELHAFIRDDSFGDPLVVMAMLSPSEPTGFRSSRADVERVHRVLLGIEAPRAKGSGPESSS